MKLGKWKFTASTYPDYPSSEGYPCWSVNGPWLYLDIDWNNKFPYGICFGTRIGPRTKDHHGLPKAPGFSLDINAPLGEPNRLYLWGRKYNAMIGLFTLRDQVETGTREQMIMGRMQTVHEMKTVWCWPRLIRGEAYDWKQDKYTLPPVFRWLVISPKDYRDRWAKRYPEEAAELEVRKRERRKLDRPE